VSGAGLSVGSGAVISQTGPAAVLSYIRAGSFTELIRRSLGDGAGFTSTRSASSSAPARSRRSSCSR
jgi:GABA permease